MIANAITGDTESTESVTESIVDAVAQASDRDPFELPPLWNAIDPEALDMLFAPTRTGQQRSGRVQFVYCEYLVTVEDDGSNVTISLEDPAELA